MRTRTILFVLLGLVVTGSGGWALGLAQARREAKNRRIPLVPVWPDRTTANRPGTPAVFVLTADDDAKIRAYADAVDPNSRAGWETGTALEDRIEAALSTLSGENPWHTTLRLIAAMKMTTTEDPRIASVARNAAAGMVSAAIGQDATLARFCRDQFVQNEHPGVRAALGLALNDCSGFPDQYGAPDSKFTNLIPRFEFDMFAVAVITDDEHLESTLFSNIPRSLNYAIIEASLDHLLAGDEQDLFMAGRMMGSVLRQEEAYRDHSLLRNPKRVRNSADSLGDRLVDLVRRRDLTPDEFVTVANTLLELRLRDHAFQLIEIAREKQIVGDAALRALEREIQRAPGSR